MSYQMTAILMRRILKSLPLFFMAAAPVCVAEAESEAGDDSEDNTAFLQDYVIEPVSGYPNSFFSRAFTSKKNGARAYQIFAVHPEMYPVPRQASDLKDPGWLRNLVKDYFSCPGMTAKRTPPEEPEDPDMCDEYCCEGECDDTVLFSNCQSKQGSMEGYAVFDEMFYKVLLFDSRIPEDHRDLFREYQKGMPWLFEEDNVSFCSQDCVSDEWPTDHPGREALNAGYLIFPTYSYPPTYNADGGWYGMSYIAKTYIKPGSNDHFGYMIYGPDSISGEELPARIKSFCHDRVSFSGNAGGFDFQNCSSWQRGREIRISGHMEKRSAPQSQCRPEQLYLFTFWSEGLPARDREILKREAEFRIRNFRPDPESCEEGRITGYRQKKLPD
ncbi:hypothetical protein [Succinimonas sp.]|uniref:hypothetical protein n=1 Tax=Succinimonas sp. TaxID=1936151 RepID=UPI00386DA288